MACIKEENRPNEVRNLKTNGYPRNEAQGNQNTATRCAKAT